NPYDQNVNLNAAQLASLTPFGGVSTYITLPNYTPVNYGIYTMTWTVNSSTPADQFPADNVLVTQFVISPPNNIASIKALAPASTVGGLLVRSPVNIPTPVAFQYRNLGVNDQTNVPVTVWIKNPQGTIVYRDTQYLNNWLSSQFRDTDFKNFTPTQNGLYSICGSPLLGIDQNRLDDTVCSGFLVAYEYDAAAISIFNPDDQEEKPEKKNFKAGAYFQGIGVVDMFDVPVRLLINRCSDNTLVFQADTIMPELNTDAGQVKMFFPATSTAGTYKNISDLPAGCYKMCALVKHPNDGDRTNDTTCTFFGIIPRLSGDINVGVGQRFQTISAAVDSLRFRGVKPPGVRLILTDANYSENGATSVSTTTAAVDFTGISFTAPDAWVSWVPKKGVSPVITFTGNKQNCFQWAYRSAPYMSFDGNNQFAPSEDLATPEPAKRGIKIINQSTTVGSIFNMQFGRHDLVLKNMVLVNNGNLTNASSRAISMQNLYNLQSFLQGVIDSSAMFNINIDNNEIGNANIGIADIGTVPLFDINVATYLDKRNHDNRITRNTIGSATNTIGSAGIVIGNEDGAYVGHNEISWVTGFATSNYGGGIAVNNGNSVKLWIDGNRIHNVRSASTITPNTLVGIDIQQPSTIYTQGSGSTQKSSVLPISTKNRITNNMIYDLRTSSPGITTILPITMTTASTNYFVDNDSVYNNSLAVANAPALITVTRSGRPFLWNNVLQNLNTNSSATAVAYNLTVPRPMFTDVSSNNNLFDLRNSSRFATLNEVDRASGLAIQSKVFASLNDWRTLTQQDIASVTGDPMFRADTAHMPNATSYILSPASNNGAWLGSQTQRYDFDGEERLVANNTPDIGADEFEGFQYVNDLAVQVITRPAGITDNTGALTVTTDNPLKIQAVVKNQGGLAAFNRTVRALVEVSTNSGASWSTYNPGVGNGFSNISVTNLNFDVAESKIVDFVGPNINGEIGKLFRVTVSVDPDQNNSNNSLSKVFKIVVKRAAVVLSYENSTVQGQKNKDSLAAGLQRLGVPYDSINRVSFGTNTIDYSPWWTVVWSTGNPAVATSGGLGVGALSLKETEEIINFFRAGQTYAKKSFIIAGENIARYNDPTSAFYGSGNNTVTDGELMSQWLHTQFVARFPGTNWPTAAPVQYRGALKGVGNYFRFTDSLLGTPTATGGPNVIKVNPATITFGDNVSRVAYTYATHPSTPLDSGAGTAWTGATFNVVFYPFDWSDPFQTPGTRDGEAISSNVSGTTRFLRGALDFLQSFRGTVLPVEFASVKGAALKSGNQISWSVATQKNVDHFEVEMLSGTDWNTVGQTKASTSSDYSFLQSDASAFTAGTFTYRIVAVDLDGSRTTSMTTSFGRASEGSEFSLEQNYPNPFTSSTMFSFTLPENGNLSLRILDMSGKVITTPINGVDYSAGKNSFNMNATTLASGTYVFELTFTNTNGEISKLSRKMTINK
ncbi:MAG: T9SS type A sorting domain-containing protein, partial [Ignavibacteriota bacterium]